MAFGNLDSNSNSSGDGDDVMNEINMTPMVDIMLVLLVIFIITVPVLKHGECKPTAGHQHTTNRQA